MKTMKEHLRECGIKIPSGMLYADWFTAHGLSLFAQCARCGNEHTPLLRAYITKTGETLCPSCAGGINE